MLEDLDTLENNSVIVLLNEKEKFKPEKYCESFNKFQANLRKNEACQANAINLYLYRNGKVDCDPEKLRINIREILKKFQKCKNRYSYVGKM